MLFSFLAHKLRFAFISAALALAGMPAAANEPYQGKPEPWQLWLQPAYSPVKQRIEWLNDYLHVIAAVICVIVLALMIYVCARFSAKNNPVPSKTSHNTLVEIIWTVLPVIVLVTIAIPSLRLIYFVDTTPAKYDMTLKVVGHQWYWSYEYPDQGNIKFDSNIVEDKDLKPGQLRLLEADNHVVVPVNATVRVLVTATDVLHSWAMPAFGVKKDAVPGRLNETWFKALKTGTYYGQCSELCGIRHAFMPIVIDVVTQQEFAAWVQQAKQKFADVSSNRKFALNSSLAVAPSR